MSVMTGHLHRHVDVSGVSGTGVPAEFAEFSDGAVAVRWLGDRPSTATWNDIRDVEYVHGHQGATEIVIHEPHRLIAAYESVVKIWLANPAYQPTTAGPHPDHPDRLRLTFGSQEWAWREWVWQMGVSPDTAIHEEVNGEVEHRCVSPDGNLWLSYWTPVAGTAWDRHDDPEEDR